METLWTFKTKRFTVKWQIEYVHGYRYDGEDENGETQSMLDSGELVAFDSKVSVWLDGVEIAADYLGSSVYRYDQVRSFRDHVGMNARGHGSYFSDMVRSAVADARKVLASAPKLRAA